MNDSFQVAGGSVVGRDHRLAGKNNQDAYGFRLLEQGAIALVGDGCSSGRHSEVGAQLGVQTALEIIAQTCQTQSPLEDQFWEQVQRSLLCQLQHLLTTLGGNPRQRLCDYGLFTLVGAVLLPTTGVLFFLGDGVVLVNGEVSCLGPFPHNQPPYLAYGLLDSPQPFQVQILSEVETLVLGTDGVLDLLAAADRSLPGKPELVGPISQFWEGDRYFTNPDQIRRRLTLINRDSLQPDWATQQLHHHTGWLRDDTTLVVLRRTPC